MIIKDCLFGQVRKLGGFPNSISTDLPNDLSNIIKKQEIMTWDNATGMNPLCDYFDEVPNVNVTKMSYGEMLAATYDMGFSCVTSLHKKKLTPDNYEAYAKLDYTDPIAGACKRLGQWWHIHHLLNHRDALKADFTVVRQIDTIYQFDTNSEELLTELMQRPATLFKTNKYPYNIPMIYELGFKQALTSYSSFITWSHAFVLNRAAVRLLQENFYKLAVYEANRYFDLIGENNYTMSIPAVILIHLAVKQEIEMIAIPNIIIHPTHARGQGKPVTDDYARIDRAGL